MMNTAHRGYSACAASMSFGPSSWPKYLGCRALVRALLPMKYLRSAAGLGPGRVFCPISDA